MSLLFAKSTLAFLLVAAAFFWIGECQEETKCGNKETCSQCVQEFGCVWCSEKAVASRCQHKEALPPNWCSPDKIVNPKSSFVVLQDDPLKSGLNSPTPVQIRPQKIKLSLRRGEAFSIDFQYAQAKNYPIDLYYIMDLSASMKDHKNKLAELGGKLTDVMRKITNNFRLGFGSFVDKVDMPFVNIAPNKIDSPCGKSARCVKAYSFKNHLPLTDDYYKFSQEVRGAKVSGNLDSPEGGFDALMQAIVCKDEIGWRPQARHIVVFSTDAVFHIAGDGKLAGIVEPNDAKCHLTNNSYTHDLVYDYPSVSHLNYIAKENNINLIFAIVRSSQRIYNTYRQLQMNIENSGVGELSDGSANVVDLVLDNYNKIADSIRITDNSSSTVDIKYQAFCPNATENGCKNLQVGKVVDFKAIVTPIECQNKTTKEIIQIKPEGVNEYLMVELEVMCDCPCEQRGHPDYVANSPDCNYNGDSKCGACSCNEGNFGNACECNRDSSTSNDDSLCRKNPNATEICSGLGTCKCGRCECDKRPPPQVIYGKHCECDNYSCKRYDSRVCSGEGRGKCDCGVCKCLSDWTGEACECPNSNLTCAAPSSDGLICSGHGSCICGVCECSSDERKYSGIYCEECASCPGQRCAEFQPCVECQAYGSGDYDASACAERCKDFVTEIVDRIDEDEDDGEVKICRVLDKDGCTLTFQYSYTVSKQLVVKALKEKKCPEPVSMWIILYVVGSIVLAGLILLIIWKLMTSIHDRREYAKFENERKNAKFHSGENPLYKKATTTFANPAYRK